jgi:hypothetical protein
MIYYNFYIWNKISNFKIKEGIFKIIFLMLILREIVFQIR